MLICPKSLSKARKGLTWMWLPLGDQAGNRQGTWQYPICTEDQVSPLSHTLAPDFTFLWSLLSQLEAAWKKRIPVLSSAAICARQMPDHQRCSPEQVMGEESWHAASSVGSWFVNRDRLRPSWATKDAPILHCHLVSEIQNQFRELWLRNFPTPFLAWILAWVLE